MIKEFAFSVKNRHYFGDANEMTNWTGLSSDTFMSLYDYDDHIDSVIFDNIDDVEISFLSDNRWFTEWPAGQTAAYKIPKLVKIEINDKDRDFEIIINPNIDYVYR